MNFEELIKCITDFMMKQLDEVWRCEFALNDTEMICLFSSHLL